MSGGSMDYLYSKVEEASFRLNTPERLAFSAHLQLVAKALHDIEWVDSCDYGPGDETAAIMACVAPAQVLAAAVAEAKHALAQLNYAIERAK